MRFLMMVSGRTAGDAKFLEDLQAIGQIYATARIVRLRPDIGMNEPTVWVFVDAETSSLPLALLGDLEKASRLDAFMMGSCVDLGAFVKRFGFDEKAVSVVVGFNQQFDDAAR